ncbi:DNA polymerase IV [Aestuariimicrobium sp. p3-SID1156]|uniref:DNA polymerase IV n=1 Tax=Aestuariimicrobium sp. p3-SID1156 TaxID=2916038 RepID=UPI00223B15EA|nr:DNA polymerase IV [Aestuariimicrobium sp. p3-SID1156]MCT1459972.1 DNA polymerase IV [Aestuariimicrobium sp. p3-SID1156]
MSFPARTRASILHLDLDAFFAAVEQRDKPSLRGKAVVVGGVGRRGVVSTASYEARVFGVRSAMPATEARRLAPHAAFLGGRFEAYRQSSRIVMALLHEFSDRVEALSLDEAFVDLAGTDAPVADPGELHHYAERLRAELSRRTLGLTASVGIGSSKLMAKIGSELAKPNGVRIIEPGTEAEVLAPLSIRAIPGVGPVTHEKLARLGLRTVADVQQASLSELVREVGQSWGPELHALAWGRDRREVSSHREAKSISQENTFEEDVTDRGWLESRLDADAAQVCARLQRHGLFARTIQIKVRLGDFTTWTRSRTLAGATDDPERVGRVGRELLGQVEVSRGIRLLGLGVSGFAEAAQEELFIEDEPERAGEQDVSVQGPSLRRRGTGYWPGADVEHEAFGRGWVWGAGLGRVTVRFETRDAPGGPVRSFSEDDPDLRLVGPLPMEWEPAEPAL